MANTTPIQTEPDVRTEAVENALPSVLLQHHSESLPQPDFPSMELDPASTRTSSQQASEKSFDESCHKRSEEIEPCLESIRLVNESKIQPRPPSKKIPLNPHCQLNSTVQRSDTNCLKSCGLQYGISEVFIQNVLEQQKVKYSKYHINPQTFDDPYDQKYYGHMLEDIMVKRFNTDDEQKIFRKSLEGMKANYQEILEGLKKNMFFCPTSFNFSSRIGENESCVPDALDEMKSSLELNPNLTPKERHNLDKIRDHLQKLRPELAEQEFVDALACFFYNKRGIFIHSFKLDDHLKVLTNKATEIRRQNKNIGFELSDFEKKLAEQLNISSQNLVDSADIVVTHLLTKPKASNQTRINGRVIRESIDEQLKGNDKMYTKKLFKPAKEYTVNEVRDGIMLGKFESECRVAGENDLFIMLPDSQLILCVEIKRHMRRKHENMNSSSYIDKNMISASQQLRKNARFISSKHGAILSPGWQFAKICAISPSVYSPDKICSNCQKFILTSDIVKTRGRLEKWWYDTGLSNRSYLLDKQSKDEAYAEFQVFFNRVVCMSSVRVVADPFHTWGQVQGNNPHHMGAGHTEASPTITKNAASDGLDFEDVLTGSHHAYKTLFFTKDQMALLTTNNFPLVIFLCDFGAGNQLLQFMDTNANEICKGNESLVYMKNSILFLISGKSLISKERCIQTSEKERFEEDIGSKNRAKPVFFVSLVGVDELGMVEKYEYIFDIYTKMYDFQESYVKVVSAQDLWTFYEYKNKGADQLKFDIYYLVEYFVEHHSDGHFVLDECPFLEVGK